MPTFLLPVTQRSLRFASSLLHCTSLLSSSSSISSNRVRFLIVSNSRNLERTLRLHFSNLLASHEHESIPTWSDARDIQSALGVCEGVILATSGSGDDVINLPSSPTDEWLQCEKTVATFVSKCHRVVKLSWTEGFVEEKSPSSAGKANWEIEEELKLRIVEGDTWAHNLTILRATMGMDVFLRGRLFELVCGRTLSTSIKRGRIAFVHPLDVAESLSAVVEKVSIGKSGEDVTKEAFKLTGPEALSFPDVAKLLSRGIGEKVSYSHFPLWAVQPARWVHGVPGDAIEEELAVTRALESGTQEEVDTGFMETLLGHKPRSFQRFIAENVDAWPRTHPT
ncbi:unnamed protein product [Peronospora belbahrii]|uniref:NmrA-like domain-containing protein n=1 Tax=Peronospora belbahrii TaxID=622444 RepID=A0AAU9L1S9_9STRA|nr:unnamed protein product [Peronospora belbahrii]